MTTPRPSGGDQTAFQRDDGSISVDDDGADVSAGSSYSSSNPGTTTNSYSRDTTAEDPSLIAQNLSNEETKKILRLRAMVIVVLILTAVAVSSVVFAVTTNGETVQFETTWEGAADKVIASFEEIIDRMGSVAGMGVSFTSHASKAAAAAAAGDFQASRNTWPFVSLDDFPFKARNVLQLSGALFVGMTPLVEGPNFFLWDDFVLQPDNYEWVTESLGYQHEMGYDLKSQKRINENTLAAGRFVDVMHYFSENSTVLPETPGQDWYLPMWQSGPYVQEGVVNKNIKRHKEDEEIALHVEHSQHAVVGGFFTAPPGTTAHPDRDTAFLATLRSIQARRQTPYLGDPMAKVYVPIFDSFDRATRKVVGIVNAVIHWKSYFRRKLPNNIQGVHVVLEYGCGSGGFVHKKVDDFPNEEDGHDHKENDGDAHGHDGEAEATLDDSEAADMLSEAIELDDEMDDADAYWELHPGTSTTTTSNGVRRQMAATDSVTPIRQLNMIEISDFEVVDVTIDYGTTAASPTESPVAPSGEYIDEVDEFEFLEEPGKSKPEKFVPDEMYESPPGEGVFFTYVLNGYDAEVVGFGDRHDSKFDSYMREGTFAKNILVDGTVSGVSVEGGCPYKIYVYPSQAFYDKYITTTPITITLTVVIVFAFAIIVFLCYNRNVERRQQKIFKQATQSTAIVSSIFPKHVQEQLMAVEDVKGATKKLGFGTKSRLKGFMTGDSNENDATAAPIADLFPHCTVFFADISGFTAWSSTREPSQVFILLQTVFQALDIIAKRRKVFKVETIGDCYMAVTGLPDPQPLHASVMTRFSYDCLVKMNDITRKLESILGPDTTDLQLRIGLHSGPVTAGVLRGERARFQLFGDTVNTASRMESTGIPGKIQVTEATANAIRDHGKSHWLTLREDAVKAKGKGVMVTYWANPKNKAGSSAASGSSSREEDDDLQECKKEANPRLFQAHTRLVDWIVKLLSDDIKKIIHARTTKPDFSKPPPTYIPAEGVTCMDEVKEVINMPEFDGSTAQQSRDYRQVVIPADITSELGHYVSAVARLYRNNPFHNFEHACHVTMSVSKLLRRIVSPELAADQMEEVENADKFELHLHDYTYGITSDPLAIFAMTFSALIHDADHQGVSNVQLGKEHPEMAEKYDNKSLAEQNSLDLSWEILMEDRFAKLRSFLFVTNEELMRFRQLIVNVVLATDIFDQELNALRKNRWAKAFSGEPAVLDDDREKSDLRATIVLEHIIQASDVSHTMQHWHVYQKWNKCLFRELHEAFLHGRLGKDPATFWYKGEIGFFDNYIIPLAKKLKDCGVFGVSSDEYLNYALQNRAEWEERGEDIVAGLISEVKLEEPEHLVEARAAIRESLNDGRDLKKKKNSAQQDAEKQLKKDAKENSDTQRQHSGDVRRSSLIGKVKRRGSMSNSSDHKEEKVKKRLSS